MQNIEKTGDIWLVKLLCEPTYSHHFEAHLSFAVVTGWKTVQLFPYKDNTKQIDIHLALLIFIDMKIILTQSPTEQVEEQCQPNDSSKAAEMHLLVSLMIS